MIVITFIKALGREDSFGDLVADGTTIRADVAGHYPFSAERHRFFENGNRIFVQYGEGASIYQDTTDGHVLSPGQDDVLTLRSAEKYRYVVGYDMIASFSYGTNRALETGDVIVVGYGNPDLENDFASADGWFFVWDDSIQSDEVKIVEYRDGTQVAGQTVPVEKGIETWKRMAIRFNWYNVGASQFTETYTENGFQTNDIVGRLSVDNGKGPLSGNQNIFFSVKRGAASSALEFEVGSFGVKILGSAAPIVRTKISEHSFTFSATDEWVPMLAFRLDPTKPNVTSSIIEVRIMEWDGTDDLRMLGKSHGAEKVLDAGGNVLDATDYEVPVEQSTFGSAIQVSENVAQAPDQTGTPQTAITDASGDKPGGYQVGYATSRATGSGSNTIVRTSSRVIKRQINPGDVVVIWGNADNTESVQYEIVVEQDW